MEEKDFENAAKKLMESEKAVSEAKSTAAVSSEGTGEAPAAAEMKSAAETIVENAAANAEVLEAEAEAANAAAADEAPEVRLDDSTMVIDVDQINEAQEAAADPDATQSVIDADGQNEQGFDARNSQYEEHENNYHYEEPARPGYGSGSYGASGAYAQAAAAQVQRGFITKKAFVIVLIIAMLFTMLASVGITTAYTTFLNKKTVSSMKSSDDHATNYTLTQSDESLSYKSIIQKTENSVVSITTESVTNDIWMQNYVTEGAGSGVIIQSDGYIITCEHVIEGARKITVTMKDGKEYDATIVGADADNDIAVIKIDATGLTAVTYGDSSKLEVGDATVVIGNPLGRLSGTVTTGIISALDRQITIDNKTMTLLQTDASINPGNSGGGMFDASGNLIGIVEAKSTGSDIDGLGFATPINKAAKIAKDIIENEGKTDTDNGSRSSSKTPKIGVTVTEVDSSVAEQYGYAHGGLLVRSISSPQATLSGISEGDIIFKADGKNVADMDDLTAILSKKKAGDKLKLSVARQDGSTDELTTVLVGGNEQ